MFKPAVGGRSPGREINHGGGEHGAKRDNDKAGRGRCRPRGLTAAAAIALVTRFGGEQREVATTGSYRLEHRCTVDDGLMSISGSITGATGVDRTVELAVSVVGPESDEPVDTMTILVDLVGRQETPFNRLLADYDSVGRGVVVNAAHSCQVEVYDS